MRYYETVIIVRQDISSSQVETLIDQFVAFLKLEKDGLGRREYWGLRNLAYRIKKNRKGHYVLLNYSAESENVAEMERNIRLSEDILRYMTIKTETLPKEPSLLMSRKDERQAPRGRDNTNRAPDSHKDAPEAQLTPKATPKATPETTPETTPDSMANTPPDTPTESCQKSEAETPSET